MPQFLVFLNETLDRLFGFVSFSSGGGTTAPDDDDVDDDDYIVGGGVGGDGYGSARRVGASLGGETKDGEKPRAAPFRTVRRLGTLTERQKR